MTSFFLFFDADSVVHVIAPALCCPGDSQLVQFPAEHGKARRLQAARLRCSSGVANAHRSRSPRTQFRCNGLLCQQIGARRNSFWPFAPIHPYPCESGRFARGNSCSVGGSPSSPASNWLSSGGGGSSSAASGGAGTSGRRFLWWRCGGREPPALEVRDPSCRTLRLPCHCRCSLCPIPLAAAAAETPPMPKPFTVASFSANGGNAG